MINNQKGFAAIEATYVLASAIGLFSTMLVYLYYCFAMIWLDHLIYEYLICIEEDKIQRSCETNFRKVIDTSLPWGKINYFYLNTRNSKEAHLEYEILNQKLHISKKLDL